jgi:hypothetical protein
MTITRYAALLGALTIAACSAESAEVASLRTSCEADAGMTPAECGCMIDKAQADLTDEQFTLLASMVGDADTPAASPADMSPADLTALMTFMATAENECSSS